MFVPSPVEHEQTSLLVGVSQAARLLQVSPRFVRLLLAQRRIPVVSLGRRRLIRRSDLDAIVNRGGLGEG